MERKDYEKYESWTGVDASIAESLCEYGFIMEWNKMHNEFEVIVRDDHNCHERPMYCYEWFNFEEWIKDLYNDRSWVNLDEILDYVGANDKDEYLSEVTPVNLLSDLLSYYGKTNVLGEEYYKFLTLEEVVKDWELDQIEDFSERI